MLDKEIIQFYNNVKDPGWPDIQSYCDFLTLSSTIIKECNDIHQFQSRRKEICDRDYWVAQTLDVCVYENLAFVPIPKCAYVSNTTMFTELGWKQVPLNQVDIDNTVFFGTMVHPLARYLKGIAEWIVQSYQITPSVLSTDNPWLMNDLDIDWAQLNQDLEKKYFKQLISTANVGDIHSAPYSMMFGTLLNRIHWIPMDSINENDVKISMMNLFKRCNHTIQLPLNTPRLHESSQNQLKVFDVVKKEFFNQQTNLINFYKLYTTELNFYYNLLETFTSDWQHI
jgi:hypothetical protein